MTSQNVQVRIYWCCMEIRLFEVVKYSAREMIKWTHFMPQYKMRNLFQDIMTNYSPWNVTCMAEVSPRVTMARFQDLLQDLWVIGHSWSLKINNFGVVLFSFYFSITFLDGLAKYFLASFLKIFTPNAYDQYQTNFNGHSKKNY